MDIDKGVVIINVGYRGERDLHKIPKLAVTFYQAMKSFWDTNSCSHLKIDKKQIKQKSKTKTKFQSKVALKIRCCNYQFSILRETASQLKISKIQIKSTIFWHNKNYLDQKHYKTSISAQCYISIPLLPPKTSENKNFNYFFMN